MRIRKRADSVPTDDMALIALASDALAHPVRLELFKFIMQKNKAMELVCTGDLVENFNYAQATISQHMNKLTVSGLIETKNAERRTYYFANAATLSKYIETLRRFAIL